METLYKVCTQCNINKSLEEYSNCKRGKYNKQPKCKECNKLYREQNRDKIITYLNNYYQENKETLTIKNTQRVQENYESVQEYKSRWYLENKDKIVEKAKVRYENNKEDIKQYKRGYYQTNKDELNKNNTKRREIRRKTDSLFDLKLNISSTIRASIKRRYKKSKNTNDILKCSVEEFRCHIESQFLPWMNWENYGNVCETLQPNCSWDLDHIIPVSLANTEEEVYLLNHWSNFQPLCSFMNRNIKKDNLYSVTNIILNITYE